MGVCSIIRQGDQATFTVKLWAPKPKLLVSLWLSQKRRGP